MDDSRGIERQFIHECIINEFQKENQQIQI